jgi:hypothetical protein
VALRLKTAKGAEVTPRPNSDAANAAYLIFSKVCAKPVIVKGTFTGLLPP